MSKYNLRNYIISLLIHISILAIVGSSSKKTGLSQGNTGNSRFKGMDNSGDIEKKQEKITIEVVEIKKTNKTDLIIKKKKVKNVEKECPNNWYGGIGIRAQSRFDVQGEEIYEVFPGYPADLVGLRVGDVILEIDSEAVIGDPGTTLRLNVLRNGNVIGFTVIRSKICFNKR